MLFNLVCQKLALPSACGQSFYSGNCIAHTAAECDREVLLSAIGFGCFPIHFSFSLFNHTVVFWKDISKQGKRRHQRSLWYPWCIKLPYHGNLLSISILVP